MSEIKIVATRLNGGFTVIEVQVDGFAETVVQSNQLRVQHCDSNFTSRSTGNNNNKEPYEGKIPR